MMVGPREQLGMFYVFSGNFFWSFAFGFVDDMGDDKANLQMRCC
jgi:hypothetical protein